MPYFFRKDWVKYDWEENPTEEEIEEYVRSGEPMDKVGAYGIQGLFARFIRRIEGDYNNVVGLPVGRLYQEMKQEGLLDGADAVRAGL